MKKIISILAVCLAFTVNAQTSKVINYPFGAAQGFTAAASGSRCSLWSPEKEVEPQDVALHLC